MKLLSALSIVIFTGISLNASATSTSITDYTNYKFGNFATTKFNVLLQGWGIQNQNTTPNAQSVRLRRSEFKLSGTIASAPKYFFMIDPAKLIIPPGGKAVPVDNMIQDFGLSYNVVPGLEITAGQFKIPTTAEGLDSSSDLPLPERSLIGRTLGDKREMGVKLAYKTQAWNIASMVSSGRSLSGPGQGMFHDLDTRIEITPNKALGLGAFVVLGNDFDYSKKGRWGVNGRYNLGQAVLRAEYAQAKDGPTQSAGITTEVGYWVTENFEPVARFEAFKPNQALIPMGQAETIGLNYYFRKAFSKIQLSGSALQNMAAVNGSPTFVKGALNKEATLALQTAI